MSGAHTPGPWVYFYKHKYDEHHVSLPLIGQSMRLGLFDDGCRSENAEANARLIAAAPELLEALKTIEKFASINHVDEVSRRACFASIRLEAQDAIAKATGAAK